MLIYMYEQKCPPSAACAGHTPLTLLRLRGSIPVKTRVVRKVLLLEGQELLPG
jgi:hypothetical protein